MADTSSIPRPVALLILDGYGQNDNSANNAVAAADTPVMDRLKHSDFLETLTGRVFLSTYAAWSALRPSMAGSNEPMRPLG